MAKLSELLPSVSSLEASFLTDSNRIQWGKLGASLAGAGIYAVGTGLVDAGRTVGIGIDRAGGIVTGAMSGVLDTFAKLTASNSAELWTAFGREFGPFAFPLNLLALLAIFAIGAWGVREIVR